MSEEESLLQCLRRHARNMAASQHFERVVAVNIVFYGILVGVEQTLRASGHDKLWVASVIESTFLVLFIAEVTVRLVAHSLQASFSDPSTLFDVLLLFSGVLYQWVIMPFVSADQYLAPVMTLRLVRVLRIVRTVALFKHNRDLQLITRCFLSSTNLTCSICAVLLLVLYVCAAAGVELIGFDTNGDEPKEYYEIASKHFGSIPVALLTLMQFTCRDNMAAIYWPLIERKPWLAVYFVSLIFAVSIVLMAVVAAVISNATTNRDHDFVHEEHEKEWRDLLHDLRGMFNDLDNDNSGLLSKEEIMTMDARVKARLCKAVGCDSTLDIFIALDKDSSGAVDINEFHDGLMDILFSRTPLALKRMEKKIESISWRLATVFDTVFDLQRSLQASGNFSRDRKGSTWSSSRLQVAGSKEDILKDMQDLHAICNTVDAQHLKTSAGAADEVVARIETDMLLEKLPLGKGSAGSSDLCLPDARGAPPGGLAAMPTGSLQKAHGGRRHAGPNSAGSSSSASRARRGRAANPKATGGNESSLRPSRARRQRSRGLPSPRPQEDSGEAAAAGLHRPQD